MIRTKAIFKIFKTLDGFNFFDFGSGSKGVDYHRIWVRSSDSYLQFPAMGYQIVKAKGGSWILTRGLNNLFYISSRFRVKPVSIVKRFIRGKNRNYYIYIFEVDDEEFTFLCCGKKYKLNLNGEIREVIEQ